MEDKVEVKEKNKSKSVLTVFAILCFVLGTIELLLGGLLCAIPVNEILDDKVDVDVSEIRNLDIYSEQIDLTDINDVDLIHITLIILGGMIIVEGVFSIIEGLLIIRASKNGRKTVLLIILLMFGIASQLLSLIRVAYYHDYNLNSAVSVVSLIIKAIILKYVLEVRRIDKEW